MTNEDKNKKILVTIVICMLLFVLVFSGYNIAYSNKNTDSNIKVKINQIYSSDYDLVSLNGEYFIGSYEPNRIDVIIDTKGEEVIKNNTSIMYDGIYKMKDDRYLIYCDDNNTLKTYVFDGTTIEEFYEIKDVNYAKPIVYKNIDKEYIIGFASAIEEHLYLYGLDSSGIVVSNNSLLVGDYLDNDIYYTYNEEQLIIKNEKNLYGVIKLNGEVVIECKYKDMLSTYDKKYVVQNTNDKYGILDSNGNKLISFRYKAIAYYGDYYLFVNNSNKMALYNKKLKKLTKYQMKYNTLIEYNLRSTNNSINLYKVNGKIAVVNNYLEQFNGTEYDKHNLYIIDGNRIIKNIKQTGFYYDHVIVTCDNTYYVKVYDTDMSLLFNVKLDRNSHIMNISIVGKDTLLIEYLQGSSNYIKKYYNMDGKEVDFKLGSLFFKDVEYKGFIKKKDGIKTLTIYDMEDNKLTSIFGKEITKDKEYLIVDNAIYRIEVKEKKELN